MKKTLLKHPKKSEIAEGQGHIYAINYFLIIEARH